MTVRLASYEARQLGDVMDRLMDYLSETSLTLLKMELATEDGDVVRVFNTEDEGVVAEMK